MLHVGHILHAISRPAGTGKQAGRPLIRIQQRHCEREPSRLEQILARYGQRWQIERDGPVWTATEHPSPTALHVIIAHDLDALEQKIIEAELPG